MKDKKVIFYKKEGRKYVPVYEYCAELIDAMPNGAHLVMVHPGGTSRRYNINPNHAAMIAAGRVAEDAIASAIVEAGQLRPQREPMSQPEKAAWDNLVKVWGDRTKTLHAKSASDIAKAGVNAMCKEAEALMTNPSVKDAYEKFLLVCALTKEESTGEK